MAEDRNGSHWHLVRIRKRYALNILGFLRRRELGYDIEEP